LIDNASKARDAMYIRRGFNLWKWSDWVKAVIFMAIAKTHLGALFLRFILVFDHHPDALFFCFIIVA